jgi:hypothetical protein
MGSLLIKIAGAREEILAVTESERGKFQALGWAILITSGEAALSMWFALASVLGFNPILSLPIALLWGLAIMGIDRWMILTIQSLGKRRWRVALPRVLLALLLGGVISTPFVLRIFQPEINNEIAVLDTQRANQYLGSVQASHIAAQVNQWQARVSSDESVINSRGQAPIDFSADKQVQTLTQQRDYWNTEEQKFYYQWQCQLYGIAPDGSKCKPGNGPLASSSHQSYLQAKQQVATLTGEITAREQSLSANGKATATTKFAEAQADLPKAQQELAAARGEQDTLRSQYESTLPKTGLLIRLQALDALSNGMTLFLARLLIFLVFLVLECLPITVKLMQEPGGYDVALAQAAEQEKRRAARLIRASGGLPRADRPDDGGGFVGAGVPGGGPGHDPLAGLWQPPTKVMPDGVATSRMPYGGRRPLSGEPPTRSDLDLEGLRGADGDGSLRARGGKPLRFNDDDDQA